MVETAVPADILSKISVMAFCKAVVSASALTVVYINLGI